MAEFDKVIPPGKEGKVNIRIDGKKLENVGRFDKTFTVRTNDPAKPEFTLVAHGTVQKVFSVTGEMRLNGFAGENLRFESDISNLLTNQPIAVTGVRWSPEAIQQGLDKKLGLKVETVEKGKKYRLKVWNKAPLKPESYVTHVILTTDYPKLKEKTVTFAVTIMNDIELTPERVIYGEMIVRPGGPTSFDRSFMIVAMRGDSLKILNAVPNKPNIKVKFKEVVPGKSWQGTVWVTPGDVIGPIQGSVKIFTNYKGYKELFLDVTGSVRREEK